MRAMCRVPRVHVRDDFRKLVIELIAVAALVALLLFPSRTECFQPAGPLAPLSLALQHGCGSGARRHCDKSLVKPIANFDLLM